MLAPSPARRNRPNSNGGGGGAKPATPEQSNWIAQLMAQARQTATQAQAGDFMDPHPTFDPAALLSAQKDLNEAYTGAADEVAANTQGWGGRGVLPGNRGAETKATLPTVASDVQEVQDAQAKYDEQLRIRRADALNVTPELDKVNFKQRTTNLSDAEYNKMSPLQKAAIDYNTMLVKAAKRDRKLQDKYDPTDEQMATYTGAVDEMFGDQGGQSRNTYAPETMAVLRQLGYKDDGAGNLDDFLQLDAAIGAKDLKNLEPDAISGIRRGGLGSLQGNPVAEERMNFLGDLAMKTQDALAAALQKGNDVLAAFSSTAYTRDRAGDVGRLGGLPVTENGPGFSGTKQDTDFRNVFDLLADKNVASENVLYQIQQEWSPEQRKQFMAYTQKRLVAAEQEGAPVTDTQNLDPRSAAELAQILKMPGFGKGGA